MMIILLQNLYQWFKRIFIKQKKNKVVTTEMIVPVKIEKRKRRGVKHFGTYSPCKPFNYTRKGV